MKLSFLFTMIFTSLLFTQQEDPTTKFHSREAVKSFADWLYCGGDFLRASLEYEKSNAALYNDTVKFKLALAYSEVGKKDEAIKLFKSVSASSFFFRRSRDEMMKNIFLTSDWNELEKHILIAEDNSNAKMYFYLGMLSNGKLSIPQNEFINSFPDKNKSDMKIFYERKQEPGYKSALLASCLSAIIPGTGKFYTNRWGDGITALITTGLMTFLSVNNFKADHQFRGWLFAGLGFFFYAGNIFGSAASAYIYNKNVDREFEADYQKYIRSENYFIPKIELCK